nr:SDR family NAD(P)-dependent oxidoreductase [Sphingomonas sp. CROZ-RG-20F-R02-07]
MAVVTGAGSGLGLDTCRALAAAGARVAALDRDIAALDAVRTELGCFAHIVDVADAASVSAALDAAVAALGRPYLAVNCAGVADAAKTVSKGAPFPLPTWDKVIAINLTGSFNLIRLAAAQMVENAPDPDSGERGVIVNTASGAATQGQVGQAAYSASKAGVIGLTLPVARDLAPHGIRVVTISPGVFETAMIAGLPPQVAQSLIDKTILFPNRMGRPTEFGALVRHIAENAYLNATVIDLDGGARMTAR